MVAFVFVLIQWTSDRDEKKDDLILCNISFCTLFAMKLTSDIVTHGVAIMQNKWLWCAIIFYIF